MTTTGIVEPIEQLHESFVTQIPYYENVFLTYKTGSYLKKMLAKVEAKHLWMMKQFSKGKLLAEDWEETKNELAHVIDGYTTLK